MSNDDNANNTKVTKSDDLVEAQTGPYILIQFKSADTAQFEWQAKNLNVITQLPAVITLMQAILDDAMRELMARNKQGGLIVPFPRH